MTIENKIYIYYILANKKACFLTMHDFQSTQNLVLQKHCKRQVLQGSYYLETESVYTKCTYPVSHTICSVVV